MSRLMRRLAATSFALLFVAGALGVQARPAAAADLTVGAAELEMIRLLNVERAKAGLVAVRGDTRLMSIARARSVDMATKNYFSHVQPDGRTVFDLIKASGITWYGAGEIIAWNTWPTLADSAIAARNGWMGSAGHKAIVLSRDYNYVGVGVAIGANGKKYWTGVFMKGPDRTGGWVKVSGSRTTSTALDQRYRWTSVSWTGGDVTLQVLTAGFRYYQVQTRIGSGVWNWQTTGTPNNSWAIRVYKGYEYDMRIRACDKAGNCGRWAYQHLVG